MPKNLISISHAAKQLGASIDTLRRWDTSHRLQSIRSGPRGHRYYKQSDIDRKWHLVDAKGKVLGKVATEIALYLQGKHKPTYTPHLDNGDFVVVINVKEVEVTRNKPKTMMYYRHSGIPGGFRQESFADLIERNPKKLMELSVKGMIPQNRLRDVRLRRLKVFEGAEHIYSDKFAK